MDWLNSLVRKTSAKKTSGSSRSATRPARARSASASKSGSAAKDTRYYVKSDNRVVTAYPKPKGSGYVYHKRTEDGVRNVPINGRTFKTEEDARKKAQLNKSKK